MRARRAGKSLHAFVRRRVVGPKKAKLLFFNVTHSHKDIRGFADFVEQVIGTADKLWKSLGHESLLNSYDEYKDFLQGKKSYIHQVQKPTGTSYFHHNKSTVKSCWNKENAPNGLYLTERIAHRLISEGSAENG
jgi:hypothetical protein